MLGANGDLGFTVSFVDTEYDGYSSDFGKTYGIGLKAGYGVFGSGIVYGGLELQQREYVTKGDDSGYTWKEHFTQKYLDIPAAFRLLFGSMYADFGAYYGLRFGDMKYKNTGDFSGSGKVEKSDANNDYGLLLGIGGIIPAGENGGIDIGFKTKLGFANVLDSTTDDYKVSGFSFILTLGYVMNI